MWVFFMCCKYYYYCMLGGGVLDHSPLLHSLFVVVNIIPSVRPPCSLWVLGLWSVGLSGLSPPVFLRTEEGGGEVTYILYYISMYTRIKLKS